VKQYAREFVLGVCKGLGVFFGGTVVGTWLWLHISQTQESLTDFLWRLVPPWRAVLPTTLALFLLGFLGLSLAYGLSRLRKKPPEIADAITPSSIYSTLATEPEDPTLDRETFEVLKWLSTLSPLGAAPVSHVAQVNGMDPSVALACVQKLWRLNFIKTTVVAPGEWNGEYAITGTGRHYVRTHAT
jgi:hypothetical protein